jgi:hypothetical protein
MRQGKKPVPMIAEELANLPVFELVHGIEVLNGCNTPRENVIALKVAKVLGKPGTGGSDCHSTSGIGYYCTIFDKDLKTQEDMLEELHAGRIHAGHDLAKGNLTVFSEDSLETPA